MITNDNQWKQEVRERAWNTRSNDSYLGTGSPACRIPCKKRIKETKFKHMPSSSELIEFNSCKLIWISVCGVSNQSTPIHLFIKQRLTSNYDQAGRMGGGEKSEIAFEPAAPNSKSTWKFTRKVADPVNQRSIQQVDLSWLRRSSFIGSSHKFLHFSGVRHFRRSENIYVLVFP